MLSYVCIDVSFAPFQHFFFLLQSFKLSCFNSRHILRKIRQAHWAIWCDTSLLENQQFCKLQKHLCGSLIKCRLQTPRGMLLFWAYWRFVHIMCLHACIYFSGSWWRRKLDFHIHYYILIVWIHHAISVVVVVVPMLVWQMASFMS